MTEIYRRTNIYDKKLRKKKLEKSKPGKKSKK